MTREQGRISVAVVVAIVIGFVAFSWPLFLRPESGMRPEQAPIVFAFVLPIVLATVLSEVAGGRMDARTLAMPGDANAAGDIFGGWVMAQMDLASGIRAAERARGRVVTAAVKEMAFAKPMKVGDTLCVYTHVARVGRTSIAL